MGRLLFVVFLIVPLIEIGLFILVGQAIGLLPTLLGVVVTALIGSAIIRAQGLSLIREINGVLSAGRLPARQLADGLMIGIAGALLLTPGYFTDTIGFLLLVPPVRTLVYNALKSRIVVRGAAGYNVRREDGVVDLDDEDWHDK